MITFHSKAYENISYFNEVAKQLLAFMGHSGTVPGALKAHEIPAALSRLQDALLQEKTPNTVLDKEDEESPISLKQRAIPLIHMLDAAIKSSCDVMWS